MKTAILLVGDYWHNAETILPLKDKLFASDEWNVIFTEDPQELLKTDSAPDLFISFKDPIENDQIPTPIWCEEEWTRRFFEFADNGMGIIFAHAAVTDLEADHPIVKNVIGALFTGHPKQCPVTFEPICSHPVLDGVLSFTFPENDEHYMMTMLDSTDTVIIAETKSQNGVQPAVWVKQNDKYRVCCLTPGHTTNNLICDEYVRVLKNAVQWCCKCC